MTEDTEAPGSDRTIVPGLRQEDVELNPIGKKYQDRAPYVILDCEPPRSDGKNVKADSLKRKKPGSREWMRFDSSGVSEFLELDKNAIMRRASISARDVRIVDQTFSNTPQIIARERVILVHLEFIRAIVTTEELFLLDATDHNVVAFVEQLKEQFPLKSPSQEDRQDSDNRRSTSILSSLSPEPDQQDSVKVIISEVPASDALVEWSSERNSLEQLPDGQPPFELRVLEIGLDMICNYLEGRVIELELKAYPTLNEITSHITSGNLELVRSLKTALTRLTAKVQRLRGELEELLDDDDDMANLCLTQKLADQHMASPSISFRVNGSYRIARMPAARPSHGNEDVDMFEMLLEAYFMQLDGTLNKLMSIREYIGNTEDYITIQLDLQRNQLLDFQMTLTIWHLAMGIGACVLGLASMNIKIPFDSYPHAFIPFVMGLLTLIAGLFSIGVMYLYWKGLFVTV